MPSRLLFVLVFSVINVNAQDINNPSLLIYSEGEDYLLPFIEKSLRSFENIETKTPLFGNVNSFNRFVDDNNYQAQVAKLLLIHKPLDESLSPNYSVKEQNVRRRIFEILRNYDFFLVIKSKSLGELIEFQFQLFKTLPSGDNIPYNIADNIVGSENFFIDPRIDDYTEKISYSLQRLFPKSNSKPIARLTINEMEAPDHSIVFVHTNTEIVMDATTSGDKDSARLIYIWSNGYLEEEEIQNTLNFDFDQTVGIQRTILENEGLYKFALQVYDGIVTSDPINVVVYAFEKSKIKLDQQEIINYDHASAKSEILDKEKKYSANLIIENYQIISVDTISSQYEIIKDLLVNKNYTNKSRDSIPFEFLLTKDSLGPVYLHDKHKNFVIRNIDYNKNASEQELNFDTTFRKSNEERKYLLYQRGPFNLLSDPVTINHKLTTRNAARLGIRFSVGFPSFKDNDTISNALAFNTLISGGFWATKNVEFELGFGISKKDKYLFRESSMDDQNFYVREFELEYPSIFEARINYHIYTQDFFTEFNSTYFGLGYRSYGGTLKTEREALDGLSSGMSTSTSGDSSFGGVLGFNYFLTSFKNKQIYAFLEGSLYWGTLDSVSARFNDIEIACGLKIGL